MIRGECRVRCCWSVCVGFRLDGEISDRMSRLRCVGLGCVMVGLTELVILSRCVCCLVG